MAIGLEGFKQARLASFGTGKLTMSMEAMGINRSIIVMLGCQTTVDVVTSVTYGGVALTRIRDDRGPAAAGNYIYMYPGEPPAGVADVVVTGKDAYSDLQVFFYSLSGVDSSQTPTHVGGGASFQTSPRTDAITLTTDGMALDIISATDYAVPFTPSGDQIVLEGGQVTDGANYRCGSSILTAGTQMGWAWGGGGSRQAMHSVISLPAFGAPVPDATNPTMSGSVTASSVTANSAIVSWPAGSDNVGIASYEYSTNGGVTYVNNGNSTSRQLTGLSASQSYTVRVRAIDAAGNKSTVITGSFTTLASGGASDTTAPTLTGSVSASSIAATTATIGWPTATDNTGVAGYEYSTNGGTSYIDAGSTTSKALTGLTASTTYQLRVRAYDAAGNRSSAITGTLTTTASGGGSTVTATITTSKFVNNTGTLLANLASLTVAILDLNSLNAVKVLSSMTTNAQGVMTITDTAIVAGTQYVVVVKNAAGVIGAEKYTAA